MLYIITLFKKPDVPKYRRFWIYPEDRNIFRVQQFISITFIKLNIAAHVFYYCYSYPAAYIVVILYNIWGSIPIFMRPFRFFFILYFKWSDKCVLRFYTWWCIGFLPSSSHSLNRTTFLVGIVLEYILIIYL